MEHILNEIRAERVRQDAKFGEQNHQPIEFMAILAEEIGEANKEIVDAHFGFKPKDKCLEQARVELIQVAAMALQCTEAIWRNRSVNDKSYVENFHSLEKDSKELLSTALEQENLAMMLLLSVIGQSYGNACGTCVQYFDDGMTIMAVVSYTSNMYMIILASVAAIHYIDSLKQS